ncbi:MAG: DNA repair protein RadA [Immundisolibacteraceae bacterium]|nr:DNA repair protein RadA [Immundisolibacteraceae bacterium]
MAKQKREYVCRECGQGTSQWAGQCMACDAWNSFDELSPSISKSAGGWSGQRQSAVLLADIGVDQVIRSSSGSDELDRVLGGGLVEGSVVLIGGDPGIGKSTLLLQVMGFLASQAPALYTSGEESARQIALRGQRLGIGAADLSVLISSDLEEIIEVSAQSKVKSLVVDSIQTIATERVASAPGAVSQVRECTARLVRFAKQEDVTVFLIGHVTKDGGLAGPRLLEHMVDTVLYFEGQESSPYRMLRAVKNRFGAVNELGLFAMAERGLLPVKNPSAIFLSRHGTPVAGSTVMACMEGTRPLLVEVQALVEHSHLGNPRRICIGLDTQRLSMLLAVMQRHLQVQMQDQDIYMNIVGGLAVTETASDLAVLFSVLSSFRNRPLKSGVVVFGEIGLSGEIRPVANGQERLKEANKLGFSTAVISPLNRPKPNAIEGINVITVENVADLKDVFDSLAVNSG